MHGPRVRGVYRGLVGELKRYVVMALLATDLALAEAPGNVLPGKKESGLSRDSVIVVPQVGAIDRRRLVEGIARLRKGIITKVESGIRLVPGLGSRGSRPRTPPAPRRESASPSSKRSPPSNSSSRRQCAIAHRHLQRGHRPQTLHQSANARKRIAALKEVTALQLFIKAPMRESASPPSKRPPPPDSSSMRQCAQRIAAFDEAIALTPATRGPTPDKTRPHRQTRYLPRTSPVAPRQAANER